MTGKVFDIQNTRRLEEKSEPPRTCETASTAYLISLHPSLPYREYSLDKDVVTVGRDAKSCDIICTGESVSRCHFRILRRGIRAFVLEDLRSRNGVFVNRRRVLNECLLSEGDLIGIGSDLILHLRFQLSTEKNRSWSTDLPSKGEWVIGRNAVCDVAMVFDPTISRIHAILRQKGKQLVIFDQNSSNGTWVNGKRIKSRVVEPTDSIMIGSTLLRFKIRNSGTLLVSRRDYGEELSLEAVGLTRQNRDGRRILNRVSLAVKPGEFIGLLGPSGAGKTTLLKALNGCSTPSFGCVLLNEKPLYPFFGMFRNSIGYVSQDDIVHKELTVEQCLNFVARLRLPSDMPTEQRREIVDSTLETLGLQHVRKNRIFQLSGGQRKRVSIGCELITKPSILFLDEPTSGLDPNTEEKMMRHFKKMAENGTTVLITTHILYNLDLLDRVAFLSCGRLVFFGKPAESANFFAENGSQLERPTQIFDILEAENQEQDNRSSLRPKEAIAEYYQNKYQSSELFKSHIHENLSEMGKELLKVSEGGEASGERPAATLGAVPAGQTGSFPKESALNIDSYIDMMKKPVLNLAFGQQLFFLSLKAFFTLMVRNFTVKLVSPQRLLFYFAVPVILALVTLSLKVGALPDPIEMSKKKSEIADKIHGGYPDIGPFIKSLFSPKGISDPRPAEDIVFAMQHEGLGNLPTPMSVLIMFVMTSVFMGTLMACLDFSTERPIYMRERMTNLRLPDYIASKLPFLFSITAVQCVIFLLLCCIKPNLRQFQFFPACLAMISVAWTSCALGLFISAADPTEGRFSVILAIVAVLPQLVFSGGLGPDFYKGMSAPIKLISDIFPARWGLEMLMTSFYHQPDNAALEWVGRFVPETIGFEFGPSVYTLNVLILFLIASGWLICATLALKRLDRTR